MQFNVIQSRRFIMKSQTGARFIARSNGTMNNRYADNLIVSKPKTSKIVRVSLTVVKRVKVSR